MSNRIRKKLGRCLKRLYVYSKKKLKTLRNNFHYKRGGLLLGLLKLPTSCILCQGSHVLPSNFEDAATGVLKVLNNLALIDVNFIQMMLVSLFQLLEPLIFALL